MYERRSRLSKAKRDRLVEHFVAGTTARAAAELVGVHRNTAASFYTRIRTVIAEETQKASSVCGESKWTRVTSVVAARANAVVVLAGKSRFSGF